jgi:LysR family transcriptional regulator, nitrogen assimilation regulatory protein
MTEGFELELLKSFLAVMDSESITLAAQRLGLTQSTISKHISTLEARFSSRLFYRDGRGVTATAAAHLLAERSRRILERLSSFGSNYVSDIQDHMIKVLMPSSVMALSLQSFFSIVLDHSPDITLRLVEQTVEDVAEAMRHGDIDIAVLYSLPDMRGLTLVSTMAFPLHLVMPSRSGALSQNPESLDIGQMDFALPARPDGLRLQVDAFSTSFGHKLKVKFEINSINIIKDLVMSGLAVSYLPWAAIARDVHAGHLRIVSPFSLSLSLFVVVPTGRVRSHMIGRISEDLTTVLERQVAIAAQEFLVESAPAQSSTVANRVNENFEP